MCVAQAYVCHIEQSRALSVVGDCWKLVHFVAYSILLLRPISALTALQSPNCPVPFCTAVAEMTRPVARHSESSPGRSVQAMLTHAPCIVQEIAFQELAIRILKIDGLQRDLATIGFGGSSEICSVVLGVAKERSG